MRPRLHIVDDDGTIREIVRRVAEAQGFSARGFDGPAPFLAALAEDTPDIVFLDLAMGEGDGISVLEEMARLSCTASVLVASGLEARLVAASVRIGRSLGLRMVEPLSKPFQLAQLRDALAAVGSDVAPIGDSDVQAALEGEQLVARYQPKLRLADDAPVGCEALVRWQHPKRGLLAPGQFMPVLEAGPAITPMTYRMIGAALGDLATWRRRWPGLTVAVNVCARSLEEPDFAERVWDIVQQSGVEPSALTLEVTETAAMAHTAAVASVLTRLRIRQINLSLDDFGTGFSSLVELHRMPFSELKVDRSFVSALETDRDARVIVKAIVGLAHTLGLGTVGEGVESEGCLDILRDLGCDVAQGFGIGQPMTALGFRSWVEARQGSALAALAG